MFASLRPKRVDEKAILLQFRTELEHIYSAVGHSSGIDPYQQVYDLCTAYPVPYDDALFEFITEFLVTKVSRTYEKIVPCEDIVSEYVFEWERFQLSTGYVDKICDYLNRLIEKKKNPHRKAASTKLYKKQKIEAHAFAIWKEMVLDGIRIRHGNRLQRKLMDMVRKDRNGVPVNHDHLKKSGESMVRLYTHHENQLSLYAEYFEKPYVDETAAYYRAESNVLLSAVDISTYMKTVLSRLKEEQIRSTRYCDSSSIEKVIKEFDYQCITCHLNRLHAEFEKMVASERYSDCSLTYKIVIRVTDGVGSLLKTLENHVTKVGHSILDSISQMNTKEPKDFVDPLLDLHIKYMDICQKYFDNDPAFTAAVDKAFRTIINTNPPTGLGTSSSEVIAKYSDWLLKKNSKSQWTESEIENRLTRVLVLFKYVEDKDVFQKFYSRLLAKRLIFASSISDDAESNMITRLKNACGFEYTAKLQRMFTDMALSGDVNRHFASDLAKTNKSLGVDFNILVLTAGSWPLANNMVTDVQLPVELETCVSEFSRFYGSVHNGRKIAWLYHLSKVDMKVNFTDRRYELNVSLHQLCLLQLFNKNDRFAVKELVELTKIPESDIRRLLKPLLDIKMLESSTSVVEESSIITLNMKFTSKRTKIKVSANIQMESNQEAASTRKAVEDDRRLFVEATIVRIMKSRKTIGHALLVQDTIDLSKSRFPATVSLVKKCIEKLIEKGYMARKDDDLDVYVLYGDVEGKCSGRFGYVISVVEIVSVGQGVLQATSGYAEFKVVYKAIVFKPFKNQVVDGVVASVNKLIPSYLQFDPNSNPPAYLGVGQEVQDTRIVEGETVRMRIMGTRVDANEIVGFYIIDSKLFCKRLHVLTLPQFAIGTIKEDFLGPSQG
ncbi:hypothetical protein HDU97_006689 [Phlyctochytrium planicorne]|nr:hypothetical protein HDU97_006689 [Phlyctochytrium planicorne]